MMSPPEAQEARDPWAALLRIPRQLLLRCSTSCIPAVVRPRHTVGAKCGLVGSGPHIVEFT
jgi:hypothetical protein